MMRAKTSIELPTGVKMGDGVTPFFDRGTANGEKGLAKVRIVRVERAGDSRISVELEIDVEVSATFDGDRGRGNPSVRVMLEPPDEHKTF